LGADQREPVSLTFELPGSVYGRKNAGVPVTPAFPDSERPAVSSRPLFLLSLPARYRDGEKSLSSVFSLGF
jgi:hypothetical protein